MEPDARTSIQSTNTDGTTNNAGRDIHIHNYSADSYLRNLAIPLQMPPLPEHFVARPEQQQALKAELLTEGAKAGALVVSAIHGLGGIGKSVLAAYLAHDAEVQAHFRDGILWVTLGQNPDLLPLLSGWIKDLGDHDYKPSGEQSAAAHLRTLLYDKQALLVVDDVWQPEHLEPFRVGGAACCVLVTTREARIPDAHCYRLDVMSPEQSLALMRQKLGAALSEQQTAQALAFAREVGYLPLALELAASQVQEGVTWQELLADFEAEVVRLEHLDLYGQAEISDDAKRRKYSLTACFNLSLKQLSPEQLQQFAWLGIVPEDVSLTQPMAMQLWQVTARPAGAILRQFTAKALLIPGVQQSAAGKPTYRMHDLMHDLAQRLLVSPVEPEQAGELPGLGLTRAAAHSEFLARYRAQTVAGQWHTLSDDGYIYAHLTWHMEQAGQPEAVHQLFLETNERGKHGWYRTCEAIGQAAGFVNDLARGWRLAVGQYGQDPAGTLAQLWRYGLIRTSLNSMASNAPAELVAALVEKGVWQPAQGLAYAQQMQDPWRRAECIGLLVPFFPEGLVPEVKATIDQIKEPAYRSHVLAKLADRFPQYWREVLDVVAQIRDRQDVLRDCKPGFLYRARALSYLIKQLPLDLMSEALEVTRQINSQYDRARVLSVLAEHLPKESMSEALEMTHQINNEYYRIRVLSVLTEHLPKELMSKALEVGVRKRARANLRRRFLSGSHPGCATVFQLISSVTRTFRSLLSKRPTQNSIHPLDVMRQINYEYFRARALSALAEQQPELMSEALEATRQVNDEYLRVIALSVLAEHLPKELMSEALEVMRQINDKSDRVRAVIALAEHLPKELMSEALEITRQINNESDRVRAVIALAEHLPKELMSEALEVMRQFNSEYFQAMALSALLKRQPELLGEALEVTRQINDESDRALILSALLEGQPELLAEILEVTRQINDDFDRANVLGPLIEQQPELMSEVREVILCQFNSKYFRARFLGALAEQQPELMSEAIEVTRQINDEYYRADALVHLIERQPELMSEAIEVTRQINDEYGQALLLGVLAERQPELMSEAIEVTRQINDESDRISTLRDLAAHLPEELLGEALEVTYQINNECDRVSILIALVERQPELLAETLDVTRQINDESDRIKTLRDLAAHLPKELMSEALEFTRQINGEFERAWSLKDLAAHLPGELMSEALDVTRQINNEHWRALLLSALAEHLPEELMSEALEVTRQINNESDRAIALSALAKRQPELLREALEVNHQICFELKQVSICSKQVSALIALAEHLPEELMPKALEVTRQINNESGRASALSTLAKHLPEELMPKALEVTRQINNESDRVSALRELVQYLSLEVFPDLIETIATFQDPYYQAAAWQSTLPRWEELQPQFPEVTHVLEILTYRERKDFISTLPHLKPIFERLGGEEILMDCVAAMREVCEQF